MEFQGKIIKILPIRSGVGKSAEWRKGEFVVEVSGGRFPRQICFSLWGEKLDQYPLKEGDQVVVYFDLESREYNERWYTEVRAWKVMKESLEANTEGEGTQDSGISRSDTINTDDLPF